MPTSGTYSVDAVRVLDTHRTPIQKQPEALLCLVGISRRYYLGDDVYPTFHYDDDRGGETAAPGMPPHEEVPLATVPGSGQAMKDVVAGPPTVRESRKRGPEGVDANAPPKSLRRDHTDRPSGSSRGGKSLAAMQLCLNSNVFISEGIPDDVNDPDPLAFAVLRRVLLSSQGVTVAEDPGSKNASSPIEVLSPGSVYRPEWGVTNGSLLDTPEACQDLVDHVVPPGYFAKLRHMPNDEFLRQYNVARREKRIQDRELEIKNLEVHLETEAEMKKAAEGKNAKLVRELEDIRAQFSGLQVSNEHLSQQVAALREQVSGEEKLKAAFEEFKRWDLKFSLLDQLEGLKDAPMDVIMAALYLESDTGEDAPQYIRDLRPSSSQLSIPVYPEGP
nr:hypothetical protein [Tanacetum cinerariifolium]